MKRLTALLIVLLLCLPLAAPAVGGLPPEKGYDRVLSLYRAALSGDERAQENDDFNAAALQLALLTGRGPLEAIGCAYMDLDGDGSPELLLGEVDPAEGERWLLDVWTMQNGRPQLAARGWERNRLYLRLDPKTGRYGMYTQGSSGAAESDYSFGLFEKGSVSMQQLVQLTDNAGSRWTLDGKPISGREAKRLLASWQSGLLAPALRPLAGEERASEPFGFSDERTPIKQGAFTRSFYPAEGGPALDVVISDTGRRNGPEAERELVLSVSVTARDGSLSQTLEYAGSLSPETEALYGLARFEDANLDGLRDLLLLCGQGAYNGFYCLSLWNPTEGRFDPLVTAPVWNAETRRLEDGEQPIELCEPEFHRDSHGAYLVSSVRDGYSEKKVFWYRWEAGGHLVPAQLFEVYDAGGGQIGDRLLRFEGEGARLLWDQRYDEGWYWGPTQAAERRGEAARALFAQRGETMRVSHPEWVHLRARDSKQSPSLAKLPSSTEVLALRQNCADGWHLVYARQRGEAQGAQPEGLTGYIWHSFLK